MATSRWHKLYSSTVAAPPATLFALLSDLPNYGRWLPGSAQFAQTTDVEPYPVQLGSRYHDGKPGVPGKDWWGTVTGFQPPGSLDFHHTIHVTQIRARIDVHIHYSFEPEAGATQLAETGGSEVAAAGATQLAEAGGTRVTRWLVLDITMPILVYPLRPLIIRSFDKENVRTLAAVKQYAERQPSQIA